MVNIKKTRTRPKLKLFIKYKIYSSIRFSNTKKLVKQKNLGYGTSIKQKMMQNLQQRKPGWYYYKTKLMRNNVFVLSKNSLSINKKYKTLLLSKQKFKNSLFIGNNTIRLIFTSKNKHVLQHLYCRIDFLLFRVFSVSSLFYARQLILNRFIKLICVNKYIVKNNFIVKPGNLVVIIKYLFYPKIKSYTEKVVNCNNFNNSNTFLLFGIDINYKTQSFILNFDFIKYFQIFSIFYGFFFSKEIIYNFYSR
jgi:ribosomal protein S4